MGEVVKVKKEVLHDLFILCKEFHPNEFIALLEGDGKEKGVVGRMSVLHASFNSPNMSSYNPYSVPYSLEVIGTVHSHPNGVLFPSRADLEHFRKSGSIHAIVGPPYSAGSISFFDGKGKRLDFKVV